MADTTGTTGSRNTAEIAEAIRAATRSNVRGALEGLISGYQPMDIAYAMGELTSEERSAVFELLDSQASGVVLEEVDDEITADLAEQTEEGELAEIIDGMPPDSGADAVNLLPADRKHRILNRIPLDEARELESLLHYGHDTAGGLMTSEVIASPPDVTALGVLEHIRHTAVQPDASHRVYVVGEDRRLLGAADLLSIINARDDQPLLKIMEHDPIAVHPDTDQEEVIRLVDRYDLASLPVVDDQGRLLGAVTVDDVIDALQQEATEDIAYIAGASADDLLTRSALRAARGRVPWLLVTLAASLLSATVIRLFSGTLEQAVMLAVFIPVITAMSGNSGLQSSMITVRAIALGVIADRRIGAVVLRQVPTALLVALTCASVAAVAGGLMLHQTVYGLIVGLAMFCAMSTGTLMGALVPMVFSRTGIDPALASGPFVTTLNDALSLLIYFGIAVGMIALLGV